MMNVDYILTTLFLKMKRHEDNDDFKEVIGDILVELLENHLEEGGFDGDNGNHHLEESDSE